MQDDLDADFDAAVTMIRTANVDISNSLKLEFYALYKQATVGPCTAAKPGLLDFTGRAKWTAWNDKKDLRYCMRGTWPDSVDVDGNVCPLSATEAKLQYVSMVRQIMGAAVQHDGPNNDVEGATNDAFAPAVSRMAVEPECVTFLLSLCAT